MKQNSAIVNPEINKIEITNENLTSRAGLNFFVKYLNQIKIISFITGLLSFLKKSSKGSKINDIFKQLLLFFADGTYNKINAFDRLINDECYATIIETSQKDMCSSSTIRRFFKKFNYIRLLILKKILKELFIWRIKIKKPKIIELFLDTFVLNNNDCKKREGVEHTYKKLKGFQPFNIIWNNLIVSTILRAGNRHGLSDDVVSDELISIIKIIRFKYSSTVPIIVKFDAGFLDKTLYNMLDKLNIYFIGVGKFFNETKNITESMVETLPKNEYCNNENRYEYVEFGFRYDSWNNMYRAIYVELCNEDKQQKLEFAREKTLIITNIKEYAETDERYVPELKNYYEAYNIIKTNHSRGGDELTHRGIKEFGTEQLPFQKFNQNAAFYYIMCISYFLFKSFQEDILDGLIPVGVYATKVRRNIFDIAGKIIKKSRKLILKITKAAYNYLEPEKLLKNIMNCPSLILIE